ncbi:hypothetical protein BJX68DRAFT_248360 [Aspergillus pseudodeflectus]|uniref:Uncharacterized protein n=1 Tax=Aspergillus pseudodeflectus TaxID=176178 RepID=A0ABR4JG37_9EURO
MLAELCVKTEKPFDPRTVFIDLACSAVLLVFGYRIGFSPVGRGALSILASTHTAKRWFIPFLYLGEIRTRRRTTGREYQRCRVEESTMPVCIPIHLHRGVEYAKAIFRCGQRGNRVPQLKGAPVVYAVEIIGGSVWRQRQILHNGLRPSSGLRRSRTGRRRRRSGLHT